MQIILLHDVARVGRKGELKQVADGYGNFLISQKKAFLATPEARNKFNQGTQSVLHKREQSHADFKHALETLAAATVVISAKASDTGHLFAALHGADLAGAIESQTGVKLNEEWIKLEKPLKEIGTFTVPLEYDGEIGSVTVVISS